MHLKATMHNFSSCNVLSRYLNKILEYDLISSRFRGQIYGCNCCNRALISDWTTRDILLCFKLMRLSWSNTDLTVFCNFDIDKFSFQSFNKGDCNMALHFNLY